MANIFEEQLRKTERQITDSYDKDLFADNYENNVLEICKIETPYLEKNKTKVSIQKEVINFHNAPSDAIFTPEQTMEVAYFQVPIVGDIDLFVTLVKHQFYNRQVKYVDNGTLYYREYSTTPITDNQELIDIIKQRAKTEIDNIQFALNEFKKIADDFNEGDFKKAITNFVSQERERRNKKSNSEDQLNPFA